MAGALTSPNNLLYSQSSLIRYLNFPTFITLNSKNVG